MIYSNGLAAWNEVAVGTCGWLLTTSAYVPDPDAHVYVTDVTDEVTDGSYARVALTGGAFTAGTGDAVYSADDPVFPTIAGGDTLGWAVLFVDTGVDATSTLLAAYSLAYVTSGVNLTVTLADGDLVRFAAFDPRVLP